jgi:hypothetical protein
MSSLDFGNLSSWPQLNADLLCLDRQMPLVICIHSEQRKNIKVWDNKPVKNSVHLQVWVSGSWKTIRKSQWTDQLGNSLTVKPKGSVLLIWNTYWTWFWASFIYLVCSCPNLTKIHLTVIVLSCHSHWFKLLYFESFPDKYSQNLGPIQPPIQWVLQAHSPEVKQADCEIDHRSPSTAKICNVRNLPSHLVYTSLEWFWDTGTTLLSNN